MLIFIQIIQTNFASKFKVVMVIARKIQAYKCFFKYSKISYYVENKCLYLITVIYILHLKR